MELKVKGSPKVENETQYFRSLAPGLWSGDSRLPGTNPVQSSKKQLF